MGKKLLEYGLEHSLEINQTKLNEMFKPKSLYYFILAIVCQIK